MTILFIVIAAGVFLGAVCLWLSGMLVGSGLGTKSHNDSLVRENEELKELVDSLSEERKTFEQIASQKDGDRADAEAETARMAVELGRIEGENVRLEAEAKRLKDEIRAIKEKSKGNLPKLPVPATSVAPAIHSESEAIDAIQAQLDMERVAHQKTKEELEQVKKIAAVKMGSSGVGGSRKGAGFQTMAISTRNTSTGGLDVDVLKRSLEKVQSEKDKIQSELARAQQELQLLKMRQ